MSRASGAMTMLPPESSGVPETPTSAPCPVCKTANPAAAKICARCGAILRRKHWASVDDLPSATTASRFPINRRRLTVLALCLLAISLVVGVAWLTGTLFTAIETPSLACQRMAGMAANGDWNRYYDRLHPDAQQGLARVLRENGHGQGLSDKELFVAAMKEHPDLVASLSLPHAGLVPGEEKVSGARAWVRAKKSDQGTGWIALVKHDGLWKATTKKGSR